jgi:lipoprotein-releasing system permease protein
MKWELFISWRYFVAKRKERFISLTSLISILGIALGVMALIVVISVMNGFDKELREKIMGVNPHIYIERQGGINNAQKILQTVNNAEHVIGASPFVNGQALFKANEAVTGVLLRGIEPINEAKVTKLDQYLQQGNLDLSNKDIIVGSELAKRFYLNVGDEVAVISPIRGKTHNFRIAGIFTSGMYDYDIHLVFTNIEAAQKIFYLQDAVSGIGVRVDNLYHIHKVRDELQKTLKYPYGVQDWMSMNKNLFSALKLEKTVMFVIVALIVVVACFNIAGHLIMMVIEKTKDIGILKAIGATNRAIKKIFTLEGLIIGFSGTFLGTCAGLLLCYLLKTYKFISLPREIYYIDRLPVEMRWIDSLIIVLCTLIISLLSTIYPVHQAAKLSPADSLRYE